jgi:KaiC/GvpD/RAD55 family RecA-like ATPase
LSERKTLAAIIRSREAYDTIAPHVRKDDFTEQANVVLRAAAEFYERDNNASSCDLDILSNEICRGLSSPKHKETFKTLVAELGSIEVSPKNIVHDFLGVRREAVGAKLATALASGKSGKDVDALVEEYQQWSQTQSLDSKDSQSSVLRGMPLSEITKTYAEGELIRIYPSSLNSRLDGGCLRGHHMVVFARPEMGKTLFLVNAIAGFLGQNLTVLYTGNEDPISDIVLRVICRLARKDKFDVLSNPSEAESIARDRGYDNLVLASLSPGTPREIESLVEEFKPDVLLIDQLRNIRMKEDNYVQQLEKAATAARNIGKKYGVLTISVTQAGDSASGKAVLEMGDVDSSNTGIPAQADVMVGIGATQEDYEMGRRILSLPKNKRSGRPEFFAVRIDPSTSRIINLEGAD